MLILSRHVGESIRIGDEITITVLSHENTKIQFSVDAPENMELSRDEEENENSENCKEVQKKVKMINESILKRESRILVIEDDKINQKVACLALKPLGCHIDIASNGKEALSLFKKNNYDLILTDLGLPDIDGIALLKKIRLKLKITTPVIVLTAHGESLKEDCLSAGANEFFVKPVNLKELKTAAKKQLFYKPPVHL